MLVRHAEGERLDGDQEADLILVGFAGLKYQSWFVGNNVGQKAEVLRETCWFKAEKFPFL